MSALLDALEYAGSVMDKPGRAVRGLLAGKPEEGLAALPFSDSLGVTDPSQRVSGSDLLGQYGMKTGNELLDSLLGMGTEVATDPTMLLGLGLGGKAAMAGSKLGKGEDLASVLFKMAPKGEPLAKVPAKNLAGLSFGPADMPLAREVEGMPPWFAEAKLRANAGSRGLGEQAARTMPPMEFDPAMFPAVAESPAMPKPTQPQLFPFSDVAWKVGDPLNREAPSILGDAVMDGESSHTLHRIAASQWEEILASLAGVDPALVRADPHWKAALLNRLVETSAARDYGHVMPLPPDIGPRISSQLGQLEGMLGLKPEDYRAMEMVNGEYVRGAGRLNPHQLRYATGFEGQLPTGEELGLLRDLAGGAWSPHDLMPGKPVADSMMVNSSPLMMPDLGAARKVAGNRQMLDAADGLRTLLADMNGFQEYYPSYLGDVLHGRNHEFSLDAIKGAIRKNPEIREAVPQFVQRLEAYGQGVPEYLLKYGSPT